MKKKSELCARYNSDNYARSIQKEIAALGVNCYIHQSLNSSEVIIKRPIGKGSGALIKKIEEIVNKGGPVIYVF